MPAAETSLQRACQSKEISAVPEGIPNRAPSLTAQARKPDLPLPEKQMGLDARGPKRSMGKLHLLRLQQTASALH